MKKSMVVDDSKIVRKVTKNILEAIGYQVVEAEDGKQALEVFASEKPDLIMLDWHMPIMNGMEFLLELRKDDNGKKATVIFCTTETELNNIHQALLNGADEYVMKPFDETMIRGKLEQLGLI